MLRAPRLGSALMLAAVLGAMVFGMWRFAGEVPYLCGYTNRGGIIVELPAEPMPVEEYRAFIEEQHTCAGIQVQRTVTGEWPEDTAFWPVTTRESIVGKDRVLVKVEVSQEEYDDNCLNLELAEGEEDLSCDLTVTTEGSS